MPESTRHVYERLNALLHQMVAYIDGNRDDAVQQLKPLALEGQKLFNDKILATESDDADITAIPQIQSIKTEMNKELRLLNTDILFLGSAQQFTTTQRRVTQLRDRLTRLIQYCDLVLSSS